MRPNSSLPPTAITAATIERIVEQAGYTRGAFYANFADKADLFMNLLRNRNEENLQALPRAAPNPRAREMVARSSNGSIEASIRWAHSSQAYAEFQSIASSTPQHAERLAQRLRDVRNATREIINAAAARGGDTLSPSPPRARDHHHRSRRWLQHAAPHRPDSHSTLTARRHRRVPLASRRHRSRLKRQHQDPEPERMAPPPGWRSKHDTERLTRWRSNSVKTTGSRSDGR